jgi:hypothetical protein
VPAYSKYADTLRKGIKSIAVEKQPSAQSGTSGQPVAPTNQKVYFEVNGKKVGFDPNTQSDLIKKARDRGLKEVQ